jgi:hypothetical protein
LTDALAAEGSVVRKVRDIVEGGSRRNKGKAA